MVVVLLALVAGQRVADARAQASWDRLSDRTSVVAPVGRSVSVRWSLDPSTLMAVSQGAGWRGTVVGPLLASDGSIGIVGLDDRDGHRRWTIPVLGPDASRAGMPGQVMSRASCHRVPEDPSRLVCLVTDAVVRITDQQATRSTASEVHLVVVDPGDGRVLAEHRLGADLSTFEAVLRGGLAVIGASSAGRSEAVGVDAASGAERWRAAVPAAGADGGFGAVGFGDLVAVIGVTGLDVLGADGAVHRSVALTGFAGAMPRSDGRLVLPDGSGTLVVGPDRDLRLDGTAVGITSDDGSLPGLTLVSAGTMRAYDDDGHQRWELSGASPAGVVVLGGVVYVTRDGGVTAVDGSTGTVRWRTDLPVPLLPPVTDGRVLLVTVGADVTALDLRTGAVLWRAPLPTGHTDVMALGGLLVARTSDGSSTDVIG